MRQQFRYGERGDSRHENHHDAAIDTGHGQGHDNFPEAHPPVRAQVLCRLDKGGVHLLQRVVDGVNHKRQVVVTESEEQRSLAQWQPEDIEQLHGSHGTEEEINPHRQYKQHRHHFRRLEILSSHEIGGRIADEETYRGIEDRYHERIQESLYRLAMREELREVTEREMPLNVREGIYTDQEQRQHHEEKHKQHIWPSPCPTRRSYLKYLIHCFTSFLVY